MKERRTVRYPCSLCTLNSWRRYQGGRTYEEFLKFLLDQLEADKGFARSPVMDKLASSFLAASDDDKNGVIAEVSGVLGGSCLQPSVLVICVNHIRGELERSDRLNSELARCASVLT